MLSLNSLRSNNSRGQTRLGSSGKSSSSQTQINKLDAMDAMESMGSKTYVMGDLNVHGLSKPTNGVTVERVVHQDDSEIV
jgi:hypothetical protein